MVQRAGRSRTPPPLAPASRAPEATPPPPFTVRFRMASRREAVAPTVERILAAVPPALLTAEQQADLAVAVAEALPNAAVHGNGLGPPKPVRVLVAVEPGRC